MSRLSSKTISLLAVLIAITCVFTLIVRIPLAQTKGYLTLADVGVYFAAFTLGPIWGAIAGGVGTGLADAIGGYPHWMILSFLIHGLQGLVAGIFALKKKLSFLILGWFLSSFIMVLGYFAASAALYGVGPALADAPANIGQVCLGGIIGIPLYLGVLKAYPPLANLKEKRSWTEE